MGFISREQFLKNQEEKQARMEAYNNRSNVGYLSLKNDGDEAIVRFCYNDLDEFDIVTTHQTTIDGKFRRVNCLRDLSDPIDACPMCKSGNPVQQRFYIRLIEYVRSDDGTITAVPRIWERPTSYVGILSNLFTEYGNIQDNVFKIKRSGKAGDKSTTYNIMYCNPTIYNESLYPKKEDAFEGYNVIGAAVLDKTADELEAILGHAGTEETSPIQTTTPRRAVY